MLSFLQSLLATSMHAALMFGLAPLAAGIIAKCRARLTGQPGASWLQPYFDLARLLKKVTLIPDTATELYPAWPYVNFAASAAAALLVPSFCTGMLTASGGDFFTLAGLLALARAATWAAGLEAGSGDSGAAVSRDLLFAVTGAAALAAAAFTLVLLAGSPSVDTAVATFHVAPAGILLPLAVAAGFTTAMAQLGDLQVVARREYSGRYLLVFEYAAMLRRMTVMSLLGALICPFGIGQAVSILSWPVGLLLWVVKLLLCCAAFALIQTTCPGVPTFRVPGFLAGAALLGVVSAILLLVTRGAP